MKNIVVNFHSFPGKPSSLHPPPTPLSSATCLVKCFSCILPLFLFVFLFWAKVFVFCCSVTLLNELCLSGIYVLPETHTSGPRVAASLSKSFSLPLYLSLHLSLGNTISYLELHDTWCMQQILGIMIIMISRVFLGSRLSALRSLSCCSVACACVFECSVGKWRAARDVKLLN